MTATVDARGRVTIPAKVREALGLHEGDTLSLTAEDGTVRLVKTDDLFDPDVPTTDGNLRERLAQVTSAFDGLALIAEADLRAGRTISVREYAAKRGLKLST